MPEAVMTVLGVDPVNLGYALAAFLALAGLYFRRKPAVRLRLVPFDPDNREGPLNTIAVSRTLAFGLSASDSAHNPDATLASPAEISASDPSVLSFDPAHLEPGQVVTVTGLKPGTATLTATSGALTTQVQITVTAGPAASIELVPIAPANPV